MRREEIESKIAEYAAKLNNLSNEDKRVKKRVLQQLGKLKKQLNEVDNNNTTETTINSPLQSSSNADSSNGSSTLLTKGHAKMKLKLLNKELAELAKKKQLKLAIKRFNWGVKKGLPVNVHTYSNLLNAYVRCGDIDGTPYCEY